MRNADKRLLLLGLLGIQKMHGYQLQQFLDEHMQFLASLKASSAYYTLERMAEEGLVEAQSERSGNRPVRQVYCLTPSGEARFRELLHENLASYDGEEGGDDIGIAFLESLTAGEAASLLGKKRELLRGRLAEVTRALSEVRTAEPVHLPLVRMRYRLEADLRWLDELLAGLASTGEPRVV